MSDVLQFERQHPDADQLTAFAEQALPAHEREQTLAHLAGCAACRQVVFLAQEAAPVELVAAVAPGKPARRWFAGWTLAFPAAAALAAMVALTVHLRTTTKVAEPVSVAKNVPQAAPMATPPAIVTESPKIVAERAVAKAAPVKTAMADTTQEKLPEIARGAGTGAASAGALGGLAAAPRPAPLVSVSPGGPMQQQYLPQPQQQNFQQIQAAPVAAPKMAVAPPSVQPSIQARNAAMAAAPMAPAPPPPKPVPSSSSVTVEAAAASMDALSDDASTVALTAALLPSHLAAVSRVSSGARSVAVDGKGAVFLSTDGGVHWKEVKNGWGGRVVTVSAPGAATRAVVAGRMAALRGRSVTTGKDGGVSGVVTDSVGAVVARAIVRVSTAAGATVATTRSLNSGAYSVTGLAPGEYTVDITAPGFETYEFTMTLAAGEQDVVRAVLTVGAASETVTVEANDAEAKAKKAAPQPVFAVTTDAGVVWVSVDGKKWKRQ